MSIGLGEVAAALVRIADAADRAVFLAEAWSANLGVVRHEDVGLVPPGPTEERDE